MDEQQILTRIQQIEMTEYSDPDEALARANEIGDCLPQLAGETHAYAKSVIQQLTHVIIDLRASQKFREKA
jgi:hypothetical protein